MKGTVVIIPGSYPTQVGIRTDNFKYIVLKPGDRVVLEEKFIPEGMVE